MGGYFSGSGNMNLSKNKVQLTEKIPKYEKIGRMIKYYGSAAEKDPEHVQNEFGSSILLKKFYKFLEY